MDIRKMIPEDAPEAAELERLCFADPWSEQALRESCTDPLYRIFVVCDDNRVIGYAGMIVTGEEVQITNVAVHPEKRRLGVGRMLMKALISEAESVGGRVMFLEVRVHNEGAIRLYEQCGFVSVGVRKNFYSHPTEDGCIYQKTLDRPDGE